MHTVFDGEGQVKPSWFESMNLMFLELLEFLVDLWNHSFVERVKKDTNSKVTQLITIIW